MMAGLHPHDNIKTMVRSAEISLLQIYTSCIAALAACISTAVGSYPYFAGKANATTSFSLLLRIDRSPQRR